MPTGKSDSRQYSKTAFPETSTLTYIGISFVEISIFSSAAINMTSSVISRDMAKKGIFSALTAMNFFRCSRASGYQSRSSRITGIVTLTCLARSEQVNKTRESR